MNPIMGTSLPAMNSSIGQLLKRGRREPEVRKLLLRVVWDRLTPAEQALAWSEWLRRHQHRAWTCHDRRRGARPPDD
jgi:DNA-binding IclR family transcriptional regulator